MLVDSHAHLNFSDYAEKLETVIAQAQDAGVEKIINIGTGLADSREAIELAQKHEGLFATVGLHPNDHPELSADSVDWAEFTRLAKKPKVVAIGECGLDYSRITNEQLATDNAEKERQRNLFSGQVGVAQELKLPLSIHVRNAQEDIMAIFAEKLTPLSGVFHCFSGDKAYLDFILTKLPRFCFSFAGNVTFKNARNLRDLAALVPLDRLLAETDCPFLTPEPKRGSQNAPANVRYVATALAKIKGVAEEKLAKVTAANAARLFGI